MKRILLVLMMAAMMLVMAAPAFAAKGGVPGPETGPSPSRDNPYADNHHYGKDAKGGQCISTYTQPNTLPDDASGGNPGYEFNKDVGAAC